MNWRTIIKESRKDKDEVHTGGYGGLEQRRTKTAGGAGFDEDKFGRIKDVDEETLDDNPETSDYAEKLAASTHGQLMEAFEEALLDLTKDELIAMLIKTQGTIKLKPQF